MFFFFCSYHDFNTAWPVKIEVTVKPKSITLNQPQATCERTPNFCLYIPEMQTRCYIWYVEWAVLLAACPFNSFNTEENRAPLANRAVENRAVNLDCGGKWTDRSGGVSSVCEQRCISVDTPRQFCVPSNLTGRKKKQNSVKRMKQVFFLDIFSSNMSSECAECVWVYRRCKRKCPKLHFLRQGNNSNITSGQQYYSRQCKAAWYVCTLV